MRVLPLENRFLEGKAAAFQSSSMESDGSLVHMSKCFCVLLLETMVRGQKHLELGNGLMDLGTDGALRIPLGVTLQGPQKMLKQESKMMFCFPVVVKHCFGYICAFSPHWIFFFLFSRKNDFKMNVKGYWEVTVLEGLPLTYKLRLG